MTKFLFSQLFEVMSVDRVQANHLLHDNSAQD